jgi:DNA-binding NarL/FixJ family response regulator
MRTSVVLVDDHAVVRDGLRLVLEAQGLEVLGEAGNGLDAIRIVQELRPDVALVDITMPGMNGIEVTREICERSPGTRVIILSMHCGSEYVSRALEAGAAGYLLKECAAREVADAIAAVCNGHRYLSRQAADLVVEDYGRPRNTERQALESLSLREREVLQLVVEGRTSVEIGDLLCLSPKTVDTYRSRLMAKLGLANIPDLVRFAIRHGLATLE